MTDDPTARELPREGGGVVPADTGAGGGAATPSFALPAGATPGLPGPLGSTRLGPRTFLWGTRTYVMGIDRKSTRLNSSHIQKSRMPSSA